ncbi:uncharacterized protein LOC134779115 isoform X1 [Penaeus indicus]|uniref:uncharacterized protein LOC134779115 isoform X1 n=1 Tax=Penaeus indicus TaxID=29960 RepID=UPI00300D1FE3
MIQVVPPFLCCPGILSCCAMRARVSGAPKSAADEDRVAFPFRSLWSTPATQEDYGPPSPPSPLTPAHSSSKIPFHCTRPPREAGGPRWRRSSPEALTPTPGRILAKRPPFTRLPRRVIRLWWKSSWRRALTSTPETAGVRRRDQRFFFLLLLLTVMLLSFNHYQFGHYH